MKLVLCHWLIKKKYDIYWQRFWNGTDQKYPQQVCSRSRTLIINKTIKILRLYSIWLLNFIIPHHQNFLDPPLAVPAAQVLS